MSTVKSQQPIADGAAKPGGVWLEDFFVFLVVKMENESALGGDPFLQSLIVYSKVISQEKAIPPSFPFGSTEVPPTVSPVPWVVKLTGSSVRAGREPSRCISHFHRRHRCRRATLNYSPWWVSCFRQGPLRCACVRGKNKCAERLRELAKHLP